MKRTDVVRWVDDYGNLLTLTKSTVDTPYEVHPAFCNSERLAELAKAIIDCLRDSDEGASVRAYAKVVDDYASPLPSYACPMPVESPDCEPQLTPSQVENESIQIKLNGEIIDAVPYQHHPAGLVCTLQRPGDKPEDIAVRLVRETEAVDKGAFTAARARFTPKAADRDPSQGMR